MAMSGPITTMRSSTHHTLQLLISTCAQNGMSPPTPFETSILIASLKFAPLLSFLPIFLVCPIPRPTRLSASSLLALHRREFLNHLLLSVLPSTRRQISYSQTFERPCSGDERRSNTIHCFRDMQRPERVSLISNIPSQTSGSTLRGLITFPGSLSMIDQDSPAVFCVQEDLV